MCEHFKFQKYINRFTNIEKYFDTVLFINLINAITFFLFCWPIYRPTIKWRLGEDFWKHTSLSLPYLVPWIIGRAVHQVFERAWVRKLHYYVKIMVQKFFSPRTFPFFEHLASNTGKFKNPKNLKKGIKSSITCTFSLFF